LGAEQLGQPGRERLVVQAIWLGHGLAAAEAADRSHRDDSRGQQGADIAQHPVVLGTTPVDLVHEDEGGDAQPPQRPHQHAGLGLHPFHGGDDQDGTVQDAQHALYLGDEIGVAGRVDQVDGQVTDRERHHRGLDRDATLALQRERIGLGTAVIDTADLADHSGGVQQPFGQARLAGVNMGHDPQVQHFHGASCPLDRRQLPSGWTWTLRAFRLLLDRRLLPGVQQRCGPGTTDLRAGLNADCHGHRAGGAFLSS
jgi:hypothetical protein